MNALYHPQEHLDKIGKLVRFKMPSLHGEHTVAGQVISITLRGDLYIRLQQGGYVYRRPHEIIES